MGSELAGILCAEHDLGVHSQPAPFSFQLLLDAAVASARRLLEQLRESAAAAALPLSSPAVSQSVTDGESRRRRH